MDARATSACNNDAIMHIATTRDHNIPVQGDASGPSGTRAFLMVVSVKLGCNQAERKKNPQRSKPRIQVPDICIPSVEKGPGSKLQHFSCSYALLQAQNEDAAEKQEGEKDDNENGEPKGAEEVTVAEEATGE